MSAPGVNWKQSIFTRLIFTFLLIILPVFILGIGIFRWSSNKISNEISSSIKSQVSYHLLSFDNDMRRVKKLQSDLTQDRDLNVISNEFKILNNFYLCKRP
jgi:two-component system, sensor histidine kinase YesM